MFEDPIFLSDLEPQRHEDFAFGGHATALSLFNPIQGKRRDTRHSGKLRFAQHFGFPKPFHIILVIHSLTLPGAGPGPRKPIIFRYSVVPCQWEN